MQPKAKKLLFTGTIVAATAAVLFLLYSVVVLEGPKHRSTTTSAVHLKQIGEYSMLYAVAHGDRMPDTLGDLMLGAAEDVPDPKIFLTGRTGDDPSVIENATPAEKAKWVNHHTDYIYLGEGKLARQLTANDVLAYENLKFAAPSGGIMVVFGDGHVEWVPMGNANQLLTAGSTVAPSSQVSDPPPAAHRRRHPATTQP